MRRAFRRLGAVQMSTAATVGNLATVLLSVVVGVHGRPLISWTVFMRLIGWHP